MRAALLCNSLDSSAALYNIFAHLAQEWETIEADVIHRGDLSQIDYYDTLVYDSAYCAALVHSHLLHPDRFRHVVFHHIHESREQEVNKKGYLERVRPQLIFVTFEEMRVKMEEWGHKAQVVPFSFNTQRFKHLPYPPEFTIGYMGADMRHKGFDEVDQAARELALPCISGRRPSHEGGPFKGRELDFYAQISCYVAAPTHESGPLPPIEAQLCGRPCVVTPVGMMPYIFEHGAGGILTPPGGLKSSIDWAHQYFEREAEKARQFHLPETAHLYEAALLEM